jgi:hypothetical protein
MGASKQISDTMVTAPIVSQRHSIFSAMGIIFILLAVFGWGVQSKISLYDAPGGNTLVPKAKLLSPKERLVPLQAVAVSAPELQTALPTLWAFVAIAFLALYAHGISHQPGGSSNDRPHVERYFGSSFFSFRPPPALF